VATGTQRPPYGAYAGIMGAFAAWLGAAGPLARVLKREPQCQSRSTSPSSPRRRSRASRTITRDALGDDVEPAGEGLKRAIGELITCSRCTGT
jgi:hypothetical protein